ncbi:hypothetical protein TELCIR_26197, partial [Teladorsagia circumcincta]
ASYVKAIDVWMFSCVGSIAEISLRRTKGSELGAAIDKAASIAFPIAFAVFNMAYWIYYMSLSSRTRH